MDDVLLLAHAVPTSRDRYRMTWIHSSGRATVPRGCRYTSTTSCDREGLLDGRLPRHELDQAAVDDERISPEWRSARSLIAMYGMSRHTRNRRYTGDRRSDHYPSAVYHVSMEHGSTGADMAQRLRIVV